MLTALHQFPLGGNDGGGCPAALLGSVPRVNSNLLARENSAQGIQLLTTLPSRVIFWI
jgi:hypothetical protein